MSNEHDSTPDEIRLLQSEVTIWKNRWEGMRVLFTEVADALGCDVKNNEAMISEIQRLQKEANANEELREAVEGFLQVLDEYPEQLVPINRNASLIRFMREALSEQPPSKDGWVKCSERMPDVNGLYLCWGEYYEGSDPGFIPAEFFIHPTHGWTEWKPIEDDCVHYQVIITHWMPLPAAPQQEVEK
ncbi:DUF551 domain-containing protein [Citrobacter sp. TBCS-15]|uniref:DUF551 domain-containing protein n=1 Tax=Citrobacter sp. TBCS-15 TaxID=2576407 RepID=UPI0010C966F5|nr:DUF551 domain-containing protein [Citrobacter sp. TBCS-15]TKT94604.1 DUF551 domain-containing protein [Citrobacter sp. TBCS-15]